MPDVERPDLRALLRLRAEREPEAPALFFRGGRGHFRWWSWQRLAAEVDGTARTDEDSTGGAMESTPCSLACALAEPDLAEQVPLAEMLAAELGTGPERDVWVSSRPLEEVAERILLATALIDGWAIVREPVAPLPAETFAWARPTILSGAVDELAGLVERFAALAPRWGSARWRRRRLARLRAVVADEPDALAPLSARLAELGASACVLPLPCLSMEQSLVVEREPEGEPR